MPSRPLRRPALLGASFLVSLLLLLAPGCTASIGDECASGAECVSIGQNAICDVSIPGGYCTVADCVPNGCPDEAICKRFDRVNNYCMAGCLSNEDCREGLVCNELGSFGKEGHGFCYIKQ